MLQCATWQVVNRDDMTRGYDNRTVECGCGFPGRSHRTNEPPLAARSVVLCFQISTRRPLTSERGRRARRGRTRSAYPIPIICDLVRIANYQHSPQVTKSCSRDGTTGPICALPWRRDVPCLWMGCALLACKGSVQIQAGRCEWYTQVKA